MSRAHAAASLAIIAGGSMLCLLLAGGCSKSDDPFTYVKVYGTVTYDDGSKIPATALQLYFNPQMKPIGAAAPRVAVTVVDIKTGEFKYVTSHKPGDGLVRGKYKVIVVGPDHAALPKNVVPADYGDFDKTPLEIDTDHLPLEIKVPKPGTKPARG
jgi:hypothetical protein